MLRHQIIQCAPPPVEELRHETLPDLPDEAFPRRLPSAVHRSLGLNCVAVACIASLFANVRPQAAVERLKQVDCGGQKSLDQKLMLAYNQSCTVFAVHAGAQSCLKT